MLSFLCTLHALHHIIHLCIDPVTLKRKKIAPYGSIHKFEMQSMISNYEFSFSIHLLFSHLSLNFTLLVFHNKGTECFTLTVKDLQMMHHEIRFAIPVAIYMYKHFLACEKGFSRYLECKPDQYTPIKHNKRDPQMSEK